MKKQSFNDSWLFGKQGEKRYAVLIPHDAQLHEKRDANCPGGSAHAFFPGGIYEYEKTFDAPAEWADKHIVFQFEGIYKNSKVYINGKEVGGTDYGYIPFIVIADGFLNYGGANVIEVTADNSQLPNSRWYTGGGIFRPVWLWVGEKTHIALEGVKVSTLSHDPARILVETEATGGKISVDILDNDKVIANSSGNSVEIDIPKAKLWNDDNPYLYSYHVKLIDNGVIIDEVKGSFGIRTVSCLAKGLFINGKVTLLRGGCVHHDNGILGAASFDESEWRRISLLKKAGFNAIRVSHNPSSRAMLEACDTLGMYVIDETWDMWYNHKTKYDYATNFMENYKSDMKAMVDRDFNHPSVIMYSIGNEVSEPAKTKGVELAKEMVEFVHDLDKNRLVTAGMNLMIISRSAKGNDIYKEDGGRDNSQDKKMSNMNSTMFNMLTSVVGTGMNKGANSKKADEITSPVLDALDIAGYNYASGRYPLEGKVHPNRVIFGSETFPQDISKNWAMVEKYPYLVGDFMWTAWDYLGETGIGAWAYTPDGKGFDKPYPWLLADVGAFDILGNPNAGLYLAQAVWEKLEAPAIAVQPVNHSGVKPAKAVWRGSNALHSWSWKGCEGNKAIIEVYFKAATIELLLNGKLIGRKKVKECKATFKTKYSAGTLKAVAYDTAGNVLGCSTLTSASGKHKIAILPEKKTAKLGEIVYVDISMVGDNGVVESNFDVKLNVTVYGGELLAFGSANPRTEECFDSGTYTTYYGRAQAIIRVKNTVTVKVSGSGIQTEEAVIKVEREK